MQYLDRRPGKGPCPEARRSFLKLGLLTAAGVALPVTSMARMADYMMPERSLSFYNTHTGERLDKAVYWSQGEYVPENLAEIDHILRDHRTGDVERIDPSLIDLLYSIQSSLGAAKPVHIISGYRSPATNMALRKKSGGVASKSLHMQGKAIDIRLPGFDLTRLHKAAVAAKGGGVGYYPDSNFVHVDTGRPRYW